MFLDAPVPLSQESIDNSSDTTFTIAPNADGGVDTCMCHEEVIDTISFGLGMLAGIFFLIFGVSLAAGSPR